MLKIPKNTVQKKNIFCKFCLDRLVSVYFFFEKKTIWFYYSSGFEFAFFHHRIILEMVFGNNFGNYFGAKRNFQTNMFQCFLQLGLQKFSRMLLQFSQEFAEEHQKK